MTYPPPSGPPPPGYSPGTQPPREPSPWTSPAVLVAAAAGVVVLIGGVVAGLLFIPTDDDRTDPTARTSTHTQTVTGTTSASPAPTAPPTTTTPRATPTVAGTDWQGFLAGPRCNGVTDPAVAIGQTARSRVIICQVGERSERLYYKGQAPEGTLEVQNVTRVGDGFELFNIDTTYTVEPDALTIGQGTRVQAEPMLAYWAL